MIRAFGESNGKPLIVLGLSIQNMQKLQAGDPIVFNTKDHGGPSDIEICILGGATENDITEDMRAMGWLPADFRLPAQESGQ